MPVTGSILLKNFKDTCLGWSRDSDPEELRKVLNRFIARIIYREFKEVAEVKHIDYIVDCEKGIIHVEAIGLKNIPYEIYERLPPIKVGLVYDYWRSKVLKKWVSNQVDESKQVDCYSKRVYDTITTLVTKIEEFLQAELWSHQVFTEEESTRIQELLIEVGDILSKARRRLIIRYKAHEIPPKACKKR